MNMKPFVKERVLLANKYFYIKGGAENSYFETARLLEQYGHQVVHFSMRDARNRPSPYERYFVNPRDYEQNGLWNKVIAALHLLYSFEGRRQIRRLIQDTQPDIAHLNNIYHQISPSIIHELKRFGIPVVMSLRDYKMVCGSYMMLHEGQICEACKGGRYYHCFLNKCHKSSRFMGGLLTLEMYLHHRLLHLYDLVDYCIAPSRFLMNKVRDMGFKGRIAYIPNFVPVDQFHPRFTATGNTIVYVGRLSPEKGVLTLVKAAAHLDEVLVKIIGEGPQRAILEKEAQAFGAKHIQFLGYLDKTRLCEEIRRSRLVVTPSECYENNPRSVIEAFALGKPAIGARIGGIPELVRDHETGMTFESGNVLDLREKIRYALADPERLEAWGRKGRDFVEKELNAETHYDKLTAIYHEVLTK
jgi:glycosyltransferase involved in cell wall biosynthesis